MENKEEKRIKLVKRAIKQVCNWEIGGQINSCYDKAYENEHAKELLKENDEYWVDWMYRELMDLDSVEIEGSYYSQPVAKDIRFLGKETLKQMIRDSKTFKENLAELRGELEVYNKEDEEEEV